MLILDTHDTSSPVSSHTGVLVELSQEILLQGIKILEVLLSHFSKSDAGGPLLVAELSESSLSLDEAVWDFLLSAESWEEDHHLEWVDIVGNDNELGLTFLTEGGDVVETELKVHWLWSNFGVLSTLLGLSLGLESGLLVLSSLWGVLGKELQKLRCLVLVDGLGELVESWWGLQSHEQDSLLSLDSDIFWPFDESGEVSLWLDISTDSEVSW